MFNVILFGAPGSGKGTQSEKLIQAYQFLHLSTGDILRNEIANNTPLGIEAKSIMAEGKLVSDNIVIGMIKNKVNDNLNVNGFLFDGFPRTIEQAKSLDNLLAEKNTTIHIVICLDVAEPELKKRLLERGKVSGRPDDVNETIIAQRVEEYHNRTSLVANYYKQFNKVVHVQGEGKIEDIYASIKQHITRLQSLS